MRDDSNSFVPSMRDETPRESNSSHSKFEELSKSYLPCPKRKLTHSNKRLLTPSAKDLQKRRMRGLLRNQRRAPS